MNTNISRVLHCFLKKNINTFNRRLVVCFTTYDQEYNKKNERKFTNYRYIIGATASFAFGIAEFQNKSDNKQDNEDFGGVRTHLPYYTMKDVAQHSNQDEKVWVTFRQGVYDITHFIDQHPGGNIIMLAAGGSLDPFWNLYGIHKQEHILKMLENFRIGNLVKEDVRQEDSSDDPYSWEPIRHPALKPSSKKPFNAEPPPQLLMQSHITPQELFYIRNHFPVPDVDPETFELEITGTGVKTKTFNLADLKKMPRYTVTATVMCAGNRRSEMSQVKPVKGLSWGHAAVGNAEWTGVKLSDLLIKLGVTENSKALHVQFEGMDTDVTNKPYGASIPLISVLDPKNDVLLAYEMNGEPLTRDHGFPVRVVAPGVVGARSVKWLSKIIVSESESDAHWQQNDYKGFSPSVDWDTVDFSKSPAIQELPVISAICEPIQGQSVTPNKDNTITVKGYAWSGAGRGIIRVDLTSDKGITWHTAELSNVEKYKPGQRIWSWTLWEANIPLPSGKGDEVEVWVKAVDSTYNTQPESFSNIWNLRGVLNNAYHRVKVKIS